MFPNVDIVSLVCTKLINVLVKKNTKKESLVWSKHKHYQLLVTHFCHYADKSAPSPGQ